jgi:hypothetical protein
MRRRSLSLATGVVVFATLVGGGFAGAAGAQTTTPRTTPPTLDPQASTFPVLQTADLPTGYRMGTGSPFKVTNRSAAYPSISKCVWTASNPFSGLTPTIYQSSFSKTADDTGQETLWLFGDAKAAKAFYGNVETAYSGATKCKVVQQPGTSSPSQMANIGKYSTLAIGDPGDESIGVSLAPSSSLQPATKYAFFRSGASVVALRISDDAFTAKQFAALARTAANRAT